MDRYKYHRRARRPRLSHCSLDRQRNDHLGRSCSRPHLFEHRWQILRGCTESDTDPNSNCDCNIDANSDADLNCDCHCYCNAERDIETFADAKG